MRLRLFHFLFLASSLALMEAKTVDVYLIDVEGGQATLIVSPSGESMLVDTGWDGFNGRDANRIAATAKSAGVKQIDYLVITHYHQDHVGGVSQLAERLPIVHFVDHGPSAESGKNPDALFAAYSKARGKGQHIVVKPGDRVPIKGLDVEVLTAGGEEISQPLPGAGVKNPYCEGTQLHAEDKSENARSVGTLIRYDKFKMIDLGDLTWNKEYELVCPVNRVGTVDVYLTTHHGMNLSGPAAIVHAFHPRVALMNNGAKKGGSAEAWQVVHSSPGLEGFWQLHYAMNAGKENNVSEQYIANLDETTGYGLKLSAKADGSFTVTNSRNNYSKSFKAK